MKTREEILAYKREWNARYLKSEKYEQRKAEARRRTAERKQSPEHQKYLEKRREEKAALRRENRKRLASKIKQDAIRYDEYLKKARDRQSVRRNTEAYRQWLVESKELRRKLKEKYRRQCGARQISEVRKEAEEKRIKKRKLEEERRQFDDVFCGPRIPSDPKIRYSIRYAASEDFRRAERDRTRAQKANLANWYVKYLLGVKDAPIDLIELKRVHMKIKRYLGELNEDY